MYKQYLNKYQMESIKDYTHINSLNNINIGDSIKFIDKKNLKFKQGGVVTKIVQDCLIIRNLRYKYMYSVCLKNIFIFHKSRSMDKNLNFMKYLSDGLNNNSFKITKIE